MFITVLLPYSLSIRMTKVFPPFLSFPLQIYIIPLADKTFAYEIVNYLKTHISIIVLLSIAIIAID